MSSGIVEGYQSISDLAESLLSTESTDSGADPAEASSDPAAALADHTPAEPADHSGEDTSSSDEPAATEAEEGGDGRESDSESDATPEPLYTVKVDGTEQQVTLKEALAGYQRNSDYTRKTQEVAKQRSELDATLTAARQQRDAYAGVLQEIQRRLGPEDQEPTADQWNELSRQDPQRYATEWANYQRRQQQRDAVRKEQQRIEGDRQKEQMDTLNKVIVGERDKLHAALPILKDAEKGPAKIQEIREFAKSAYGYTDAELNQAYDHRLILFVHDAMQWRNHLAAQDKAKAKVSAAKPLPEPKGAGPRVPPSSAARREQQRRFEQTGRIEDALPLLLTK